MALATLVLSAGTITTHAQEPSPGNLPTEGEPTDAQPKEPSIAEQLKQLEAAYEKKLKQTQDHFEAQIRNLNETKADRIVEEDPSSIAEQWTLEQAEEQDAHQDVPLDIYGYFDVTFVKTMFEKESLYSTVITDKFSFYSAGLHLMAASQMTQHLSALVELQFTLAPNGAEINNAIYDEETGARYVDYERVDTHYVSPMTSEDFWHGAVSIERMHFTWAPRDWLKILAGRFLTPYGIWNMEHGPTVIIPSHPPMMQIRRMVPPRQLGLQLFGTFFPRSDSSLEYYITVSNGRDGPFPTDTVDLDNNKALGAGLRYNIAQASWSVSAGGYGYLGDNTDHVKNVYLSRSDLDVRVEVLDVHRDQELDLSAYILAEIQGLRLQTEFVWRRVDYEIPPPLNPIDSILSGQNFGDVTAKEASYTGWDVYGLIAYQLPLDRWLNKLRILPYILYESTKMSDIKPYYNQQLLSAGINLRPSPWTTIKFEYLYLIPESHYLGTRLQMIALQAAISF